MRTIIALFLSLLTTACSQQKTIPLALRDIRPTEKEVTDNFPTEKEVEDFLKIGLDKQLVVAKFGEPSMKDPEQNGIETFYYIEPPYKPQEDEIFVYSGFEIYFAKNKVSGFDIIHRNVRAYSQ